jgi:hypothetical protein
MVTGVFLESFFRFKIYLFQKNIGSRFIIVHFEISITGFISKVEEGNL